MDGSCVNAFGGDSTIAGGWTAFVAASGQTDMTVLSCGCADFTLVSSLATPCGGPLTMVPAHEKRTVSVSWGTWSHGYTGEIFWTRGSAVATYLMPDDTDAFDFYMEPNSFATQGFTITGRADNGDTAVISGSISGLSGAIHFGFWVDVPCNLASVSIVGSSDWGIGEMRMSCEPETAKKILVYDNNTLHQLGLTAARTKSTDVTHALAGDFNTLLGSQTWDIVVFDCPSTKPVGGFAAFEAYVKGGGKAVAAYWDWDVDTTLAAAFDCEPGPPAPPGPTSIDLINGVTLLQSTGAHDDVFAGVAMPNNSWHNHWADNGDEFTPMAGAIGLAHIGNPARPVMVMGNGGNTIALFDLDEAGDLWLGNGDAIELWQNMIHKVSPGEPELCVKVCQSNPTSVGPGAHIEYKGEVASGIHRFSAEPVPNQPGIFFHGANQIRIPFGNGFLCTGGGIVRLNPPVVGVGNRAERDVLIPPGMGIRYWQYWFRDPMGGGELFNTTNALCCDFDAGG